MNVSTKRERAPVNPAMLAWAREQSGKRLKRFRQSLQILRVGKV